jgi:hypothetical protein
MAHTESKERFISFFASTLQYDINRLLEHNILSAIPTEQGRDGKITGAQHSTDKMVLLRDYLEQRCSSLYIRKSNAACTTTTAARSTKLMKTSAAQAGRDTTMPLQ